MGLIALDAALAFQSPHGTWTVPADRFFTIPEKDPRREKAREADEILTTIHLPVAAEVRSVHSSVKERAAFDWPLVSTAVALRVEGDASARPGSSSARWRPCRSGPLPPRRSSPKAAWMGRRSRPRRMRPGGARPLSETGYKVELVKILLGRTLLSLT